MTIVDELYQNHTELLEYLQKNNQISLLSFVDNTFKKVLVLASASFFEEEIKNIILEFANNCSSKNSFLVNFIKNKAIHRKYHEYFNWDVKNANHFFGLFGEEFKTKAVLDVERDLILEDSIKSFLELGKTRNDFVHQNFASITLDKTAKEYYDLFKSGNYFVEYLKKKLGIVQ